MSDRLSALRLFIRVAHTGSFSRAAREFALSQPSASRIIADLEREIGTTLFVRTTRAVKLTARGSTYLEQITPLLAGLEAAEHTARNTGELRGRLRIALSSSFGVREVIPRLPAFLRAHPKLRLDVLIDDAHQHLVTEGVDVALRFGRLADSTATAKQIASLPRILVASANYLRDAGDLQKPDDLVNHSLIAGPGANKPVSWMFHRNGRRASIRSEARVTCTSNEAAIHAAVAGLGIVSTVEWGCRAELARGTLVTVLKSWKMNAVDVNAIFPAGRKAQPAARAFVEYLAKALDDLQRQPM